MSDQTMAQQLLRRIKNRRRTISAYLRSARPRAERLTYVAVISSALAAALTAGPALGGPRFTSQVAGALNLGGGAPAVWRPLCLLAMIVSVIAAISANLSKSKNAEARIISAEACHAELEALETLVEFEQVPLEDAVKLYQQYIARVPFVSDTAKGEGRSKSLQLICLVRGHTWHQGRDNKRRAQVWTCDRCGRRRVRTGEVDPRKTGWTD